MIGKITMRLAVIGSVVLVPVAVAAAPASAAALVVHPDQSIQAAVDAAHSGATVVVTPGTYLEAVCVTTDGIKLRGSGAVILPPAQPPQTPCADPGGQTIGIALVGIVDFGTGQARAGPESMRFPSLVDARRACGESNYEDAATPGSTRTQYQGVPR